MARKDIISFIVLGLLIIAIPIGIKLLQNQQILKSKAATEKIIFSGTGVNCSGTTCTTTSPTIDIGVSSTLGLPQP